jgi:nucleotide-binding universal stress UspA family protein
MKKILVPIDGSVPSQNAATKAVELARHYGSEIKFLTVAKVPDISRYGVDGIDFSFEFKDLSKNSIEQYTKMLDDVVAKTDCAGITFEKKVLIGEPYEEILKYAAEENCDYIIMGRRGFSKIKRFFVGSVTQRVISESSCPVLIVQ